MMLPRSPSSQCRVHGSGSSVSLSLWGALSSPPPPSLGSAHQVGHLLRREARAHLEVWGEGAEGRGGEGAGAGRERQRGHFWCWRGSVIRSDGATGGNDRAVV